MWFKHKNIMGKKLFAIFSVLFIFSFVQTAVLADGEPIMLGVTIDDPEQNFPSYPKTPIVPPSVSLDDHTLYFATPCDGCTLNIVDGNGVVVYTIVIPTGTTSLVLPATLSGEYGLQIISGIYLFFGTIDLP